MERLTLTRPDDWHLLLRDGAVLEAVLPEYLWPFRPQGQYDAITNSAKNLKN